VVEAFCQETDFDPYSHNFEALEVAIEAGALDVMDRLATCKTNVPNLSDHMHLLVSLLDIEVANEKDAEFRDEIAYQFIKKRLKSSPDLWDEFGYAAFIGSPNSFDWVWCRSSDQDKIDITFLFLTRWTRFVCDIPEENYNKLRSEISKLAFVGNFHLWFECSDLNIDTFADCGFHRYSEHDLLLAAKEHIDKNHVLFLRILMSSRKWRQFSVRQNLFALVKYLNQVNKCGAIRDLIIQKSKSYEPLTWPQVFDSLCEMPDLSSLKRKRSEDQDKTNKKTKK